MKKNSALKTLGAASITAAAVIALYNYSKEQSKPINKMKRTVENVIDNTADTLMNMNLTNKK